MRTIELTFSDACSDVLVYLAGVDRTQWRTAYAIVEAVAPPDVDDPARAVRNALGTLRECGLVEAAKVDDWVMWQITAEGRDLVAASTMAEATS